MCARAAIDFMGLSNTFMITYIDLKGLSNTFMVMYIDFKGLFNSFMIMYRSYLFQYGWRRYGSLSKYQILWSMGLSALIWNRKKMRRLVNYNIEFQLL